MLQGEASPHPGVGGQEEVGDRLEGAVAGEAVGDIPLGAAVVVEGEEGIQELERVKGHQELLVVREVLRGQQHRSPSGRERERGSIIRRWGTPPKKCPHANFKFFLAKI